MAVIKYFWILYIPFMYFLLTLVRIGAEMETENKLFLTAEIS